MFFKKKEEKDGLPDLPAFPLDGFSSKKPVRPEIKELDGTFGRPIVPKEDLENSELEDEVSAERHSLPSFPDSPMGKGFSQSAIRDAVSDKDKELEEQSELPELPDVDETPNIKEIVERPIRFKEVESEELYKPTKIMEVPKRREEFKPVERNQDIFVKLDKFKAGRKSLLEVKERMNEIDFLLKKIRETKMREEQELAGWESELNAIKDKIKDVTENIFEKV
jgi:hypothetical protein